jgi:hypothetical protein
MYPVAFWLIACVILQNPRRVARKYYAAEVGYNEVVNKSGSASMGRFLKGHRGKKRGCAGREDDHVRVFEACFQSGTIAATVCVHSLPGDGNRVEFSHRSLTRAALES